MSTTTEQLARAGDTTAPAEPATVTTSRVHYAHLAPEDLLDPDPDDQATEVLAHGSTLSTTTSGDRTDADSALGFTTTVHAATAAVHTTGVLTEQTMHLVHDAVQVLLDLGWSDVTLDLSNVHRVDATAAAQLQDLTAVLAARRGRLIVINRPPISA